MAKRGQESLSARAMFEGENGGEGIHLTANISKEILKEFQPTYSSIPNSKNAFEFLTSTGLVSAS